MIGSLRIQLFLLQVVLSAWSFRKVLPWAEYSRRRQLLSQLWLLALFPLFTAFEQQFSFGLDIWGTCLRFFYRALIYTCYLRSLKRPPLPNCIYLALLISILFTICQDLVQLSIVFGLGHPLYNLLYIPIILIFIRFLPLSSPCPVTLERWLVLATILSCLLYTKTSFFGLGVNNRTYAANIPTYLVLLHVFLLLFLLFFERYIHKSQEAENLRVQDITNQHLLTSLNARVSSEKELRALHHDMKNHLLAVHSIALQEHCTPIVDYTQDLLAHTASFERNIKTGNPLLDALLTEKAAQAAAVQIRFTVSLDFSPVSGITAVDLCTIFSNALDNAIEACKKVQPPERRFIDVKGSLSAQYLFVGIENAFAGRLRLQGGWPVTTKRSPEQHGFGLSNLRRTMKRCQGVAEIHAGEDGRFILTLIFPASSSQPTGGLGYAGKRGTDGR